LGLDYEIIFVNDASQDDSDETIRKLSAKNPFIMGVTHSRSYGYQAAFRSGLELSAKEACVLMRGDLGDPPELIEDFVRLWREGADVIFGRLTNRGIPAVLEFFYKLFYRVFETLSEFPIPKDAGDFSLLDRNVVYWVLKCREKDYFLRGIRAYVGFRQIGVDYVRSERDHPHERSWFDNVSLAKKAIFSFTRVPLHMLTVLGGLTVAITFFLVLWTVGARFLFPQDTPKGITFMALLIMFFGSAIILGIGLLGEYLGKIFEETKSRPPFIRQHLIKRGCVEKVNESFLNKN
jgi:dolichol-phosphate mannosyltransferase